ncbi:hypothetical protein LTS15_002068 [Exophiala xenobiotica]|nr:hypothetical protein LTS15_002068 [Exophiala xenobiotica]
MKAYGASLPLAIAIDRRGDVLLAFKMNDKPLPCDHGFPARSVKWVNKIVVSDEGSNTTWQRRDYKCFGPNEKAQDWGKHKAIQEMPVTSAITRVRQKPTSDQGESRPSGCVGKGSIRETCLDSKIADTGRGGQIVGLEGYAYLGGGQEIQQVDVSFDGSKTWDLARLLHEDANLERENGGIEDMNHQGLPRQTTFVVKAPG